MSKTRTKEDLKRDVEEMRRWLESQPHLPKDLPDGVLARFVHSCYFDLEKAKTAAELFLTIRGSAPELLTNRDPMSPAVQKCLKIINLAHIRISGNRQLWIWQLNDPGLETYDYVQDAKMNFLTTDAWLLENKDDEDFPDADIVMLDVKDISLKFLAKFNVSVARKLLKYQEEAIPIRLSQVHVVNAPNFIDKLFSLMKPFLKQELTDTIHFHTPKSTTLYDYISKEDLPSDYGGKLPSMDEYNKIIQDIIKRHREELKSDNLWRATVDNKKSKKKESQITETSFRSLAID